MIVERPAAERGRVDLGWLDSRHTFSFGHYHDPRWMGFGPLRVINEDRVAPGGGFAPHSHANMEILSVVLSGGLAHRDDNSNDGRGTEGVIRPGEVQWMSAGHGIEHSEYNASNTEPVHFLQIWIEPEREGVTPAYSQKNFDLTKGLTLIASPDGAEGSLKLNADARLWAARLEQGQTVTREFAKGRFGYVQVARGEVKVDGEVLKAGDGLQLSDVASISIEGGPKSEVLVFDLDGR